MLDFGRLVEEAYDAGNRTKLLAIAEAIFAGSSRPIGDLQAGCLAMMAYNLLLQRSSQARTWQTLMQDVKDPAALRTIAVSHGKIGQMAAVALRNHANDG